MNAPSPPHPTDQILYDYGLGKLGDPAASAVDLHLEACPACRQRVSELSGDSFVGRLRDAGAWPEAPTPGPAPSGGTKKAEGPSNPATVRSPDPDLAGSLPPELADNPQYQMIRELGRGGMGVVYLARNTLMDRLEVLKVLNKEMLERKGTYDRFLREVRAAARLSHPNVVGAYSAAQVGHLLVFAMEYVEGADLSKLVKSRGPLPVAHACSFIHQAALGLQHAHERGMVHRDIKPANLMLMRQGQRGVVKILDFGLAKASSENPIDGGLTREGQMLGTPDFIAPEQTIDAQKADIRADIYSLGCTLYYLLAGDSPFHGTSLYQILQAHHSIDAKPLNLVRPEVPVELEAVVGKMMAKERERRFQTPAEVAEALKPFFKPKNVESGGPKTEVSQVVVGAEATEPAPAGPRTVAARGDAEKSSSPGVNWASLLAVREPEPLSGETAAVAAPARGRLPWVWPTVAVGVLLLVFVVGWAAGVFKLKTDEGDLVFSGLPAHAVVSVDGKVYSVEWPGGKGPARVTVPVGEHRVKVALNGVEVYGEEVKIATGKETWLTLRLERPESRSVSETNPWPGALALAGQLVAARGRIAAMSPDGQRLAVMTDKELQVVEAPNASKVFEIKAEEGLLRASFSPDGKYLAATLIAHPIRIWDAATGEEVRRLKGGGLTLAYSPDGKRLAGAAAFSNQLINVWDTATGATLATVGGSHANWIWCLAFSPDGKRLVSGSGRGNGQNEGSFAGELKLWDLETGTGTDLEGHALRVNGLAFSPDGKRLASASFDKTVKVWDLATRKCLVTFDKHQEAVGTARFSPDGRLIASYGSELPVRVWESATGREVSSLMGLPSNGGDDWFLQFSPEGRSIYSAKESTLKAWETPTGIGSEKVRGAGDSTREPKTIAKQSTGPGTHPKTIEASKDAPKTITNSIGMKLALIPAGEFLMGSPASDKDARPDEKPQHRMRITRPFYLGVTEVTQGQYRAVTGQSPSNFKGSDDLPVEQVSWNDAIAFCDKLSELEKGSLEGVRYRLPTEVEWEYACRAGSTTRFSFGDDEARLDEFGWYNGNKSKSNKGTHPVGQKRPNAWGLYDMHGSLWEWCGDTYQRDYSGPSLGEAPDRRPEADLQVRRGACWNSPPWNARSAARNRFAPERRDGGTGFRVARVPSRS